MSQDTRAVVITGASSGIGRATAERLARAGWVVFAGVRKEKDADTLSALGHGDALRPIILDVAKSDQIAAAAEDVSKSIGPVKLRGLVNNAGIANMGPLPIQAMDEVRAHFEVNVLGLIETSQAFAPLLGMDRSRTGPPGRIVNISSVGGRVAAPFLGAYTATKHAVESITDTFRREMIIFGVDAICIGPGAVKTPIWDKAEERDEKQPYANSPWAAPLSKFTKGFLDAGENGWPPERIAEVIETALTDASPKARYAPVPGKFMNFTLPTRLPKRWLDRGFWSRFDMSAPSD